MKLLSFFFSFKKKKSTHTVRYAAITRAPCRRACTCWVALVAMESIHNLRCVQNKYYIIYTVQKLQVQYLVDSLSLAQAQKEPLLSPASS